MHSFYDKSYRSESALKFGWFFLFYLVSSVMCYCGKALQIKSNKHNWCLIFFSYLIAAAHYFLCIFSCGSSSYFQGKIFDVSSISFKIELETNVRICLSGVNMVRVFLIMDVVTILPALSWCQIIIFFWYSGLFETLKHL